MPWPYVDIAELETRLRERADLSTSATNPQFVTSAEARRYLQKSWEKLYNYLVGKYEDYFIKTGTEADLFQYKTAIIGLAAGVKDYSFGQDYAKLIKIDLREPGTYTEPGVRATTGDFLWTLKKCPWLMERRRLNPDKRNRPRDYILFGRAETVTVTTAIGNPNGVRLLPTPDAAYQVDIIYVPKPMQIPAANETGYPVMDFIMGWDEYVVLDSAIKVFDKRREDPSILIEERADFLKIIEDAVSPRDGGQPHEVLATREGFDAMSEDLQELYID